MRRARSEACFSQSRGGAESWAGRSIALQYEPFAASGAVGFGSANALSTGKASDAQPVGSGREIRSQSTSFNLRLTFTNRVVI